MKVLVALDSFKGTMTAAEACRVVADALLERCPAWQVETVPMADGGEGTAAALVAARQGEWVEVPDVVGPLPVMRLTARYGWLPRQQVAVVEMAAASGLPLLTDEQLDPMHATTYGTGQLIADAIEKGAKTVLLTLGGSATVDGGTGAASALGWRFLDAAGRELQPGGGALSELADIDQPRRRLPRLEALCDVSNPLCGDNGAAVVYGPQKGATPEMIPKLDAGLRNLAGVVERKLGKQILTLPGAGAAGGFGGGAVAFFDAELVPGIEAVLDVSNFRQAVEGCDWVIAGEGRFDTQSLQGKVVSGVRDAAQRAGARVAVLAGTVQMPETQWRQAGINLARPTAPPEMPAKQAIAQAKPLLAKAAAELARLWRDA